MNLGVSLELRKWTWLDSILLAIRTLWVSYQASTIIPLFSDESKRWILFFSFVLLFIVPYIFYRPGYMNVSYFFIAECALTGSMFVFLMHQFHEIGVYSFFYFPIMMIGFVSQERHYRWIGPLLVLGLIVIGTWTAHLFTISIILQISDMIIFYILGYTLGRVAKINNKMKVLISSIQEKNKTLEQYSKRIEELTIIEERNRVSQDLHDTVGHIFTSVITSLDALPFLIKANQEEAESYIKEISNLARKGLDDVRHTIHQLSPKGESLSLSDSFKFIVQDFMKHTGTKTDIYIQGTEKEIGKRMKTTLIRCLQESLTNAKRHGKANQIYVELMFKEDAVTLEVEDNGIGSENMTLGFGISTMKDRLASMQGLLSIQSSQTNGTKIMCTIPLAKEIVI